MKTFLILLLSIVSLHADAIKTKSEIVISVKGIPAADAADLNGTYSVYANGYINMPYIKNVKASGKTASQLAAHIESLYKQKEIFTNPTVNVNNPTERVEDNKVFTFISDSGSKVIPYRRDLTLQSAIAAAGGAGTFDSKRYAYVERGGESKKYDLDNATDRNLKIYANDVIRLPHVNDKINIFKKILGKD